MVGFVVVVWWGGVWGFCVFWVCFLLVCVGVGFWGFGVGVLGFFVFVVGVCCWCVGVCVCVVCFVGLLVVFLVVCGVGVGCFCGVGGVFGFGVLVGGVCGGVCVGG
ncbi:hypothetical protein, partial [Klebsiella pneumoniae]|uniref:hypothetical protein n=1 Tax=Klebsiella pneumoniae TaxID=573 RepID=UPI001C3E24B4